MQLEFNLDFSAVTSSEDKPKHFESAFQQPVFYKQEDTYGQRWQTDDQTSAHIWSWTQSFGQQNVWFVQHVKLH